MRAIPLLLAAAALTGCVTQPPPATRSAEAEAEFQKLVAGKVAGNAISCLPSYRSGEMVPIDNSTVAFKNGSTVYVNHLIGECSGLKSGWYTLVTRSSGPGMCRGDIADVADVRTGMVVGSCAIGDFTPYTRT
ncbi:MAG TPA: hypothetical protein VF470_03285 [Sphingomicrobium sp.]|jgi:hypothetical protein